MGEVKHTSGPWIALPDSRYVDGWQVVAQTDGWTPGGACPDGWFVADAHDDAGSGSAEANAHLIAAAPDMFEALNELLSATREVGYVHYAPLRAKAKRALARARGEAA